MSFAASYEMRERVRAALRWLGEHRRIVSLLAVASLMLLVYCLFFLRPLASREMVILYRPEPDRASVVFNLGDEYRVRSIRLISLDERGREGETLWKLSVPGDVPRLSTFSFPPRGRGAPADDPPPVLEPGRTYRLKVSAAGARGTADFRLDPSAERRAG